MKDIRFYLEFPSKAAKHRSGKENKRHAGNVYALYLDSKGRGTDFGVGAVYSWPNSPVATTGGSREWLQRCKRIPEKLAREIHPRLFDLLK